MKNNKKNQVKRLKVNQKTVKNNTKQTKCHNKELHRLKSLKVHDEGFHQ